MSIRNLTCARVKVHLVTSRHAEVPTGAAQSSEVRGLWTVIIINYDGIHEVGRIRSFIGRLQQHQTAKFGIIHRNVAI